MNILPKYFNKKSPLTIKSALEDCVVADTERSKSFIYKKFYGYLMAVALRYMKDEMEAEDVVNESFVKIFRKAKDFKLDEDEAILEKTFKSWMARITVNTSIDKLRAKKEVYSLDDLHENELLNHSVAISTKLEENDILSLLNKLPEIQKTIFNLYEIEGYSHEEIGKLLDIPDSTSRTYLTRAKSRLRKLYTEQLSVLDNINHS